MVGDAVIGMSTNLTGLINTGCCDGTADGIDEGTDGRDGLRDGRGEGDRVLEGGADGVSMTLPPGTKIIIYK